MRWSVVCNKHPNYYLLQGGESKTVDAIVRGRFISEDTRKNPNGEVRVGLGSILFILCYGWDGIVLYITGNILWLQQFMVYLPQNP